MSYVDFMKEIQEGLLTNAKVYIHVTIWIKVVTQTAMYSQYIIYMIYKGTNAVLCPWFVFFLTLGVYI